MRNQARGVACVDACQSVGPTPYSEATLAAPTWPADEAILVCGAPTHVVALCTVVRPADAISCLG